MMPEIPRRVLIIRPSALGDVCKTTPVLASLRAAFPRPHTRIDWLVQDTFAEAIADHPALDGVVPFARSRMGAKVRALAGRRRAGDERGEVTIGGLRRAALGTAEVLASLRRADYDLVIDCQGLFRSGVFALATGAPVRVGLAGAREWGWIGVNRRVNAPETMHTVERMLEIVRAAGVTPVADDRLFVSPRHGGVLERLGVGGRYAVIAPGSRWPGKRWPAERFAAVAKAILAAGACERVVIVGSRGERADAEAIFAEPSERIIDAMGRTSVGELMALVKHAAVVIGNDSAVVHMAVGFGRPLVGLYGPTDVAKVGPWRRSESVIQHVREGETLDHKNDEVGKEMMERIAVDEVTERASLELRASANAIR